MQNGIIKYRKRPVVIEAIQYTGLNPVEIKAFVGEACRVEYYTAAWEAGAGPVVAQITIHTLEGDMEVSPKDYVIKGVDGEFYPCKPDIFAKTYERVEPSVVKCSRCGRPMNTEYAFKDGDDWVCGDCNSKEERKNLKKW